MLQPSPRNFKLAFPRRFAMTSLKAGQQFAFVAKGDTIVMIPRRTINEVRGMFKGANTENVRDRTERT